MPSGFMKICQKFMMLTVISFIGLLSLNGCARYAHNVSALYEPSAGIYGGTGEVYVIIPESQQTQSSDVKWGIGKITDGDNMKIDDVVSPRSPAEIIQAALVLELKKGGYTVTPTTKHHDGEQQVIDITKAEIKLEQVSALADLKATCRVLVGMDVFKNGKMVKRLQYESESSKTDVKDRDFLAKSVLEEALQSIMLKATPDLHGLFKK